MRRFVSVFAAKKTKKDEASDKTHSSGSSSGSASVLHTPEDDHHPQLPLHTKRSWRTWLGAKRAPSILRQPPERPRIPTWSEPPDESDDEDNDNDDGSEQSDTITIAVSPFVQQETHGPLFPRSVNRSRLLPRPPCMRVHLLKTRLPSADLARKPAPVRLPLPTPSFPNASRPPPTVPASPGIRRWITRPCFEERYLVYLSSDSGIDCRPVSAASLAIAALEYSDHLDVMADPDYGDDWTPPDPPPQSHASAVETLPLSAPSPAAHSRNSYTAVPSPLRNEHGPQPIPREPEPVPKTSVKRVVRFAEDDSDDGIPLHLVRQKKKREQKAKFLRQEQIKRAQEEVEDRRRQEQEAVERERQRLIAEKEKRERDKVLHAETVAAARVRRETQRAGGVPSLNNNSLLVPSSSSASLRDLERNRPTDPRRLSSSTNPRRDNSDSPSSYHFYPSDSSPSSSRPPSISHSPVHHSRPPSTYSAHTSSSEDVRQSASRRSSTMPPPAIGMMGYGHLPMPMIMSYPTWSGSNPNFQYMPPVPPFPMHDMPLLPPAAPFMKHSSYDRRSSRNSSPGSSTPSSRRGSFNSSSEGVNQVSSPRKADPLPKPSHTRKGSSDSKNTSYTQQSVRSSSRPPPLTSRSQPVVSRGRPQQNSKSASSQQLYAQPNPWTALPTHNGLMPATMPYSHNLNSATSLRSGGGVRSSQGRKQTHIS